MTAVLFTCSGQRVDVISAFREAGALTVAADVRFSTEQDLNVFFGWFTVIAGVAEIAFLNLLQLPFMRRYGLIRSLVLPPFVVIGAAALMALVPAFWIVVAAVGRPKMVKADWVKSGATVIDVGINRMDNGKLCGDVDFDAVVNVAGAITPVPGGVGPMTIACLMQNTLKAARK